MKQCRLFLAASAITALGLSSCGPGAADGPVEVAVIGEPNSLFEEQSELSPAAQYLIGASREGLVSLDANGQVIPALAERWIVTDDGLSYIFRLRERTWPDEDPITAQDVQRSLRALLKQYAGTALALDLAKLVEIRAMTERVVELRLSSPMPDFLRLMAQPELGIAKSGSGAGPMIVSRDEGEDRVRLSALPPEERGLPRREDWQDSARSLSVQALSPGDAIEAFKQGDVDLILNGQLAELPQVELGPLSRGTIQLDPALGLMGLAFQNEDGLLSEPERREALSMALDRNALIAPFNIGGWQANEWIVPPVFFNPQAANFGRWDDLSFEERQALATSRINGWRRQNDGSEANVSVFLPEGPGSDLLFDGLALSWGVIGVIAKRAQNREDADLLWRDDLARYSSPRWFLNRFNCTLETGLCSPEADDLVRASKNSLDPQVKAELLSEAHKKLMENEVFIPLGTPVRWSLVRGAIDQYAPNRWGLHPLFPLSGPTI